MNLATWLARSAERYPEQAAIAHGTELWCDYAEFARRAGRTAHWLQAQGVRPGDRVALFMRNAPAYLPLFWGTWWCGAVVVPINAKLHPREAAWIAHHSETTLAFCDAIEAEALGQAIHELGGGTRIHTDTDFMLQPEGPTFDLQPRTDDDPAWLFYTSGTTGRPKGVVLCARQLRGCALAYLASVQSVQRGDTMLHPAPLSHGGGMYHLPYVMQAGLNVVPRADGFEPVECLELAAHWRQASFFAAPTMVRRLVDVARQSIGRPSGLSTIVYGGGPMYLADIEEALQVIGPHFAQIYGQGECPMTITVLPKSDILDHQNPRYRERLSSVGHAQSMVELTVCNQSGQPLPVGEVGEICVRSEVVMAGYWRDPDATAKAIRQGWLATGDVGRLDADGYLTLLDRSKDLVISGGTNIYPREVEEALLTHPDVAEVSVIGRTDPEWGEVVVAFVVCRQPLTVTELDAHCLNRMARFKRPKHYHFVASLPKNNYGKVVKTELRKLDAKIAQK
jgi:acyl-CoA synthetase (AMP-forming)/AMP-acid ligase II